MPPGLTACRAGKSKAGEMDPRRKQTLTQRDRTGQSRGADGGPVGRSQSSDRKWGHIQARARRAARPVTPTMGMPSAGQRLGLAKGTGGCQGRQPAQLPLTSCPRTSDVHPSAPECVLLGFRLILLLKLSVHLRQGHCAAVAWMELFPARPRHEN